MRELLQKSIIILAVLSGVAIGQKNTAQNVMPQNDTTKADSITRSDTIPSSIYTLSAVRIVKTGDRRQLSERLAKLARQFGGWFTVQAPEQIAVRIPSDSLESYLTAVDTAGLVVDRSFLRTDLSIEHLELHARRKAKKELLEEYLVILDNAGADAIYAVSRKVVELERNIEELTGKMQGLLERMKYAEVHVHFRFNERQTPQASGWSDFGWLNTLNLSTILGDFRE